MFKKRLEIFFILTVVIALLYLVSNIYAGLSFKNNDISDRYKQRISNKEQEVLSSMQRNFGRTLNIPLIVTDKLQGRLYGLTSYNKGKIKIFLNKKVMQESMDYIVDSVIAHEYAHALIFAQGNYRSKRDGHSELWRETCIKLGGKDCHQYVDTHEIIMSKVPFN
jgi:predicted SprT family Zn-dependent metalloprotease